VGDIDTMLDLLRRFAVTMASSFEINDVLYQLGDSAVEIFNADSAGVSLATQTDRLEFITATDQSLIDLEMVQQARQEGPCVLAFRTGEPVAVSDISELDLWPEYRDTAARSNLAAVLGMPLAVGERRVGVINVYARQPREWSEDDVQASRTLADIATAYIVRSGELTEAHDLTRELQHALDSRVIIEQAKGVLSRHHAVSVDDAFGLLRSYARRNNARLRDVAHSVVHEQLDLS
jgi:GAF domain-containing protein